MQTLNLVENSNIDFNAFKIFTEQDKVATARKLALAEQLQTSLELNGLLNIFSMEVAKYADFSGLYFKNDELSAEARGSHLGKNERRFELRLNNDYIGTLTYALNSPISLTNFDILTELHQLLIHPINNAVKYQQALKMSMQDALTSLGNRRYFDEQLKRAMHHANRQGSKVALMIGDLNKFKQINDTHGHHIGDNILKRFASVLRQSVRDSDSVFRFGGDEFVILIEDADTNSMSIISHRVHSLIAQDSLLAQYQVSTSLGATLMTRSDTEDSFFERADQQLYANKMAQGNSVYQIK
ncbi:GGDEF domain-containing protein [Thalassotalea marina]|uniref:diguanylate cyclase n=1 Tax=Thalassotalea marina TaxID=1673741 RepID=A0A919BQJ9_9GAMM|nr:GGDEF domain-containing protein [Thalassotalea marina]GHG06634.1 GGDEF domain-containing protein [Thalassotalea marina]